MSIRHCTLEIEHRFYLPLWLNSDGSVCALNILPSKKSRMKTFRRHPGLSVELVMWLEHTTCWLRISCSTDWAILAYHMFAFFSLNILAHPRQIVNTKNAQFTICISKIYVPRTTALYSSKESLYGRIFLWNHYFSTMLFDRITFRPGLHKIQK